MITNKTARDLIIAKKLFPGGGSVIETDTASGAIANFETNMEVPIVSGIFEINPYQEGTGNPSPSNPRAIHGYTGLNVRQTGANLWDEQWEQGLYDPQTGLPATASNQIRSKNNIPIKSDIQLYVVVPSGSMWAFFYDANGDLINSSISGVSQSYYAYNVSNKAFTTPSNAVEMKFYLTSGYGGSYNSDVSVNYPSTDTSYHAYTATTYPISWQTEAGTVYGGYLNITTGVLTVTWIKPYVVDANFGKSASGLFQTESFASLIKKPAEATTITGYIKASIFNEVTSNSISGPTGTNPSPDGSFAVNQNGRVYFNYLATTDINEFKTALSNSDFIFELAIPTEVELTPQEVRTLLGSNNIYHDCNGDSTITYKKSVPGPTTTDKRQFLPLIYGKKYYRKEY